MHRRRLWYNRRDARPAASISSCSATATTWRASACSPTCAALPEASGGPVEIERDAVLPCTVLGGLDDERGLRLLAVLRERGAQVRLVAGAARRRPRRCAAAGAAGRGRAAPPRGRVAIAGRVWPGCSSCSGGCRVAYFRFAAAAAARCRRRPRPALATRRWRRRRLGSIAAPHRLNDEAVRLNAAGQFADAADRLRAALERAPTEPALRRNLKTVLHNWAVAELNADHTDGAVALLEEGLAIDEDPNLLSALGIARVAPGRVAAGARRARARRGARRRRPVHADRARQGLPPAGRARGGGGDVPPRPRPRRRRRRLPGDAGAPRARARRRVGLRRDAQPALPDRLRRRRAREQRRRRRSSRAGSRTPTSTSAASSTSIPSERVPVVLYPSEDFHDVTQTPSWTSGVYDGRIKLPVGGIADGDSAVLERTLRHEYGHVLVHQLTHGRCPVWLNEGVAIWCRGGARRRARGLGACRRSPARCSSRSRDLEGSFTRLPADRVHVAYAQSYLAVRALVERSRRPPRARAARRARRRPAARRRVPRRLLRRPRRLRERASSTTDQG